MLNAKPALLALALIATSAGAFALRPTTADPAQAVQTATQAAPADNTAVSSTLSLDGDAAEQPADSSAGDSAASPAPVDEPTSQESAFEPPTGGRPKEQDAEVSDEEEQTHDEPSGHPEPVEEPGKASLGAKVLTAPPAPGAPGQPSMPPVFEATSAANAGSASYDRSAKGHRLWLDIRFDLDEYDDVVVDYGDGTTQTLKGHLNRKSTNVATDGTPPPPPTRWRTDHSYELALIAVEREVSIAWIGQAGVHVETFTARPRAVFDLTFQPLTFTAEASCDWHSPGDFTVKWDQGRGWYETPKFHLSKGESKTFDEFSFSRGGITLNDVWRDVVRFKFEEHDRLVSRIVAPVVDPTRWKVEFKGVPPGTEAPIVQMLGDHTVPVVASAELGHECYVSATFDATLDLYEG